MPPMTRLLLLSLVAAWIASGARAQERTLPSAVPAALADGDCAYGTAEQFLDVGDVRAALYTTGTLFRRESTATYTVPYTPGVESAGALFSLNLWVGGEVEGFGFRDRELLEAGAGEIVCVRKRVDCCFPRPG